jgi:hypothetical protein
VPGRPRRRGGARRSATMTRRGSAAGSGLDDQALEPGAEGPRSSSRRFCESPTPVGSTAVCASRHTHSPAGSRWRATVRSAFRNVKRRGRGGPPRRRPPRSGSGRAGAPPRILPQVHRTASGWGASGFDTTSMGARSSCTTAAFVARTPTGGSRPRGPSGIQHQYRSGGPYAGWAARRARPGSARDHEAPGGRPRHSTPAGGSGSAACGDQRAGETKQPPRRGGGCILAVDCGGWICRMLHGVDNVLD